MAARDTITFKQAGESWIANCRRRRLEETTIISYQQHLDDHLYPLWQDKKLNELTNVVTQTLYEDLLEGDRTLDMVRRVRIDAGAVLNYAKSKGWVGKNVIYETPFEFSKRGSKRPEMPTMEEGQRMIAHTLQTWPDWLAFVLVLVFCGLRASEVRALSWTDVDFASDTITVLRRADRWGRIGQPKSAAGTRTIPIPKAVRDALIAWKPRCPSSKLNLVFPSSRGTVQNQSNIMNRFFRLMQVEAGIYIEVVKMDKDGGKVTWKRAKFGLHALRHFCAPLWIEANYSAKRVQAYMGHASIVQIRILVRSQRQRQGGIEARRSARDERGDCPARNSSRRGARQPCWGRKTSHTEIEGDTPILGVLLRITINGSDAVDSE